MVSIQKLESDIAKLKAQLRQKQLKQLTKLAKRGTKARLKAEKAAVKRALGKGRFSDFVKMEFKKAKDITFKQAVKQAKKAFDEAKEFA